MDSELATNVLAAYAAAGQADRARTLLSQLRIPEDELTYEVAYNTACVWIEAGSIDEADRELLKAESELVDAHVTSHHITSHHVYHNTTSSIQHTFLVLIDMWMRDVHMFVRMYANDGVD